MFLKRKDFIYLSILCYSILLFLTYIEFKTEYDRNVCDRTDLNRGFCLHFCCDNEKFCTNKKIHENFNVSKYLTPDSDFIYGDITNENIISQNIKLKCHGEMQTIQRTPVRFYYVRLNFF